MPTEVQKFLTETQRQIDEEGLLGMSGTHFDQGDKPIRVLAPKTPPPPPTPPPCRLSCSSCGYTAPEPEFRKNHPRCNTGLAVIVLAGTVMATLFVMAISMFL